MTTFLDELKALLAKHNLHLQGTLRIVELSDQWENPKLEIAPDRSVYGGIDRCGPFLVASISPVPPKPLTIEPSKMIHINPDIAGYDCPVTGKWISSRAAHRENLKRQNCRLLEPGEKREAIKDRERSLNEAIDRVTHEAVMRVAHQIEVEF